MQRIKIRASRAYEVCIAAGLRHHLGGLLREQLGGSVVMLVSDETVYSLYGQEITDILENTGYTVHHFIVPVGEESKNIDNYCRLVEEMAKQRLSRSDIVLALGGGVVGDLTGFAASSYLRGLRFVQLPTTVLAMVDSSVGGKTAVNLAAGKNLMGAFYQPHLVVIDPTVLATLPQEMIADGCAEIIKYAILREPKLLAAVEHCFAQGYQPSLTKETEELIAACVRIKQDFVAADEFDIGARQQLNFGHTIGHAIEGAGDFTLRHGQAVAIGMRMMTKLAVAEGSCAPDCLTQLEQACHALGLPTETQLTVDELLPYMIADKKRSGSDITLVWPQYSGSCYLKIMPVAEFEKRLKESL
ncbi:MAG: 3-dehydroquinate synthase [Eubacteriales bacterium]|nr:3-dehydroquinate synthase [Eubacteriales bacterium]